MRRGTWGGWLIAGGGVAVVVAVAKYLNGDGVGFGSANIGGVLIDLALGLFAGGAIVLSAMGPEPLDGRLVRAGLGFLALGQLGLLGISIGAAASLDFGLLGGSIAGPATFNDTPATLRTLALAYLVSGAAGEFGLVLVGLGLVRRPGGARLVGAVLFLGCLLVAATVVAAGLRVTLDAHTALWAIVVAIAGDIGIGLLVITRPSARKAL